MLHISRNVALRSHKRTWLNSFFVEKAKQTLNKHQFIRKVCAPVWKTHHEAFQSCVYFYILCLEMYFASCVKEFLCPSSINKGKRM